MEELTYIIKRILQMIPVLLIITLIIFFGMRLIPGDPALLLVGNRASDEVIEAMRTKLGLSEPLYVQYFLFLKQCLTFNFGNSLTLKSPVSDLFRQKAVITVSLTLMTALFSVLISFPLGYISGIKHNSKIGSFIDSCSLTFHFGTGIPHRPSAASGIRNEAGMVSGRRLGKYGAGAYSFSCTSGFHRSPWNLGTGSS